ncbi:MAG: uroporphyrinogen decarboxylase family protein [Spirochaetia bacterium]
MTHRERVLTALGREQPDRCPLQISFTPEFAERLRKELGIAQSSMHNPHGGGNTYALERALEEDCLLTSVGWANSYYAGEDYTDEWGVGWSSTEYSTPFGPGRYTEIVRHPLAGDAAVEEYTSPDPTRPELYTEAERVVREFGGEYWIVGVTVTTIFETAWALRGLERLLIDFALDPPVAERVLDFPFRYHLEAAKRLVEIGVDMLWLGDDVGTQTGLLISPDTWRRFLKPRMAEFVETVRRINSDIKIAYHSDGNILPLIPELIEIGIDVLNPIQPACMDPAEVKRRFGKDLCFWGSIDEQQTLPFGSPEDVRDEVSLRLETIGKDGGLIIGPTHHVQLDTPLENLFALIEAVKAGY